MSLAFPQLWFHNAVKKGVSVICFLADGIGNYGKQALNVVFSRFPTNSYAEFAKQFSNLTTAVSSLNIHKW